MTKIKNIKNNLLVNQPVKVSDVMAHNDSVCHKVKGIDNDISDSDEEDHIWKASDMTLKGIKSVISSLSDKNFEWSKGSKDGKESNKNFNEWLDCIMDQLHNDKKKNDDQDIFN